MGAPREMRNSPAGGWAVRLAPTLSPFVCRMTTRDMASKPARWENPLHPMAGPYVYDFSEGAELGRELLGGKGAGLAEMTAIGIPVPAGFTVTTEACREYMRANELPEGLEREIDEHLGALEEETGKRFGDPEDPLLVSVRSGAAVSMPGMMDTILNLGLNDEAVEGLARATGNERFAQDAYRRLIQMYGDVVAGVDAHRFERELTALKERRGAEDDVDLSADDLSALVERFKEVYREETGEDFPQDARAQLERAVRAVFDSWDNPRAQVYRRANGIPDDLGTAVSVVQMVFGNKGEDSGTGVAFTRDPSTGEQGLWGEFVPKAQGEDVVAGIRTPEPLGGMKERMPAAFEQLLDTMGRLEEHFRDVQDIEFTVEDGRLYLLQTRSAQRTARAAIRIAVDTAAERGAAGEDVVLVRWETTPDDIHGLLEARGVLTAQGGMTSHAAVVARGMGKPCVAGCESVAIDLDARRVRIGEHELEE